MQWNDDINAGFNTGAKTWLPVGPSYIQVNVAKQESDVRSHFKIFKKLVQLHKKSAFRNGLYESGNNLDENVFYYVRADDDETYLIALNFAKEDKVANFSKSFRSLKNHGLVEVASLNSKIQEK